MGKNMMEFKLNGGLKEAVWKPKVLNSDEEALDVFNAGVIYASSKNAAWILGGLKKQPNKSTVKPSRSIYRMKMNNGNY